MKSLHLIWKWLITATEWNQGPFCVTQIFIGETGKKLSLKAVALDEICHTVKQSAYVPGSCGLRGEVDNRMNLSKQHEASPSGWWSSGHNHISLPTHYEGQLEIVLFRC